MLRSTLLSSLAHLSAPINAPTLRLLYFHHVFDDQVASFRRLIEYLLEWGKFISTDEVLQVVRGEKSIGEAYFHVSFDDGFKNVITNALPVLREHNIPAILFVPTEMISAEYELSYKYCRNALHLPMAVEMATWDDLSGAVDLGCDIASHSKSHTRLSRRFLSTSELENEIAGSKHDIEKRLGISCRFIAWPYGRAQDIDSDAVRSIRECGYCAAFSAIRGTVVFGQTNPFCIPRHHIDLQWPFPHIDYFLRRRAERGSVGSRIGEPAI